MSMMKKVAQRALLECNQINKSNSVLLAQLDALYYNDPIKMNKLKKLFSGVESSVNEIERDLVSYMKDEPNGVSQTK